MKTGERVRHKSRPELGIGILELDGQSCRVTFPKGVVFSGIPANNFHSAEEEYRQIVEAEKERITLDLLRKEKEKHFQKERKAEAKRQKKERLHQESLLKKKEIKRNKLFAEIQEWLESAFLEVDEFYCNFCADLITKKEFEEKKIQFVKQWIEENTPPNKNGEKDLPDDEQIAAIAAVHGHIQVIARAGSGKTTTLVNRTLFLIKHCGVSANEMLLLAFNRKAALDIRKKLLILLNNTAEAAVKTEISNRISEKSKSNSIDYSKIEEDAISTIAEKLNITLPHIMTFHALAYAIVNPGKPPLHDKEENERQELSNVFQNIIDNYLQLPEFKNKIRKLMLDHYSFNDDWSYIVDGSYDINKNEFLKNRRSLDGESLNGEYVKSFGEKLIANFLFEHDIEYKYERNFNWSGINYRPDFTIFQTDKTGIIIEYFGLQGDADYDEMTQQKRDFWQQKDGWTLVEIYPHNIAEHGEERFIQILRDYFQACGFPCIRLSEDEIWQRIKDRAIDQFTKAMVQFIGRCRKQSLSVLDLKNLITEYNPILDIESKFHELALHFYEAYLDKLSATGQDDFDGLMKKAADLIQSGETIFQRKSGSGNLKALHYLCIDEFQDFSELFYNLLNAIRAQNTKVELFCVGDDWQAINGFAGSDLRFFQNFTDHIGESTQLYISTNYRSSQAIVNIGNDLMTGLGKPAVADKEQIGEVVLADIKKFEPSLIEKERYSNSFNPMILRIINKALLDDFDVVILSRKTPSFEHINFIRSHFSDGIKKKINFSTTHKYKGLQKSVVIIPDAFDKSYPLIHPNWIFLRILGNSPETITEEERRLFYVALTRAIEKLVIITEEKRKSPFLQGLRTNAINWAKYPPVSGEKSSIIIKVGNQTGYFPYPTLQIKKFLIPLGYQWNATSKTWAKIFPFDGFDIEIIKNQEWAKSANGIEVCLFDETEKLLKRFLVDAGKWNSDVTQGVRIINSYAELKNL